MVGYGVGDNLHAMLYGNLLKLTGNISVRH